MSHIGVPTRWRNAEGHTDCAEIARRSRTPRGQRPRACAQSPRTGTGRSRVRLWPREPQTASGSPRTYADGERAREVGPSRSTWEAAEHGRGTGHGGGRGKGTGQGELARAQRAPDAGPGRRAQRARAGTGSSPAGSEAAVHGAPASRVRRRAVAGCVLRAEAGRGGGHRRRDVGALWPSPGGKPPGPGRTAPARGVPSEAGQEGVHPEGGRGAAAPRGFPRWKTRWSSVPSARSWAPSTRSTSSGSRTGSDRGVARIRPSTRSRWGSRRRG
jgi:hypothetical protein